MERWRSHISESKFRRVSADSAIIRTNLESMRISNNASLPTTNECHIPLHTLQYYYVQSPNADSPCGSSGGDSGVIEVNSLNSSLTRDSVDSDCTDHSNNATTCRHNLFSLDLLSNSDCSASSSTNGSPFESFESILESDLISSLSSCSQSSITAAPPMTNFSTTSSTTPPCNYNGFAGPVGTAAVTTPWDNSLFAQESFREGFRASDNMMFDTCNMFPPQLQTNDKTRGMTELNKTPGATAVHHCRPPMCMTTNVGSHYSGYNLHPFPPLPYNVSSCQGSPVTQLASPVHLHPNHDQLKRVLLQKPPLPKRISLPDHLQYHPLKLLTMKQSMHIESQLERSTPDEQKQFTAIVSNQMPPEHHANHAPNQHGTHVPNHHVTPNHHATHVPPINLPLGIIQNQIQQVDFAIPPVQHSPMGKAATILHQHRLQSLHQKRSHQLLQKHSRRQIFRQASYHIAQKYSVLPGSTMDQSTLTLVAGVDKMRLCNSPNANTDVPFVGLPSSVCFQSEENSNNVVLSTPLSPIDDLTVIEKDDGECMDTL